MNKNICEMSEDEAIESLEALTRVLLVNLNEFQRLIEDNVFLRVIAKTFPQHADALIQITLSNPKQFQRLITNNSDLRKTAEAFPRHAETLIQKVLSDPSEFHRLITNNSDLRQTAKAFPKHAETLIQKVLSNPNVFQRLFRTQQDLYITSSDFPQYEFLLKKNTLEEAIKAVKKYAKSYAEIRKNARTLNLARRPPLPSGPFNLFPAEILAKIAALTADPDQQDQPQAYSIALPFLQRPNPSAITVDTPLEPPAAAAPSEAEKEEEHEVTTTDFGTFFAV